MCLYNMGYLRASCWGQSTFPLGDVIHHHLVPYELYADDNQLADSFPSRHLVQGPETVAKVKNCVADV